MVEIIYSSISLLLVSIQFWLAKRIQLKQGTIFAFLFFNIAVAVMHYRVLAKSTVFDFELQSSVMVDIAAFIFLIASTIVPINKITKRQRKLP